MECAWDKELVEDCSAKKDCLERTHSFKLNRYTLIGKVASIYLSHELTSWTPDTKQHKLFSLGTWSLQLCLGRLLSLFPSIFLSDIEFQEKLQQILKKIGSLWNVVLEENEGELNGKEN